MFGEEEWGMTWLELDENQLVSYTIVEIKVQKTGWGESDKSWRIR